MTDFDGLKEADTGMINIAEKLASFEKTLYENQIVIDQLKYRVECLERSFLEEVTQSAKHKFDDFRDYIAEKIRP